MHHGHPRSQGSVGGHLGLIGFGLRDVIGSIMGPILLTCLELPVRYFENICIIAIKRRMALYSVRIGTRGHCMSNNCIPNGVKSSNLKSRTNVIVLNLFKNIYCYMFILDEHFFKYTILQHPHAICVLT